MAHVIDYIEFAVDDLEHTARIEGSHRQILTLRQI